eukprot:438471_1
MNDLEGDVNAETILFNNSELRKPISIPISISTPVLSSLDSNNAKTRYTPPKMNQNDRLKIYRRMPSYKLMHDIINADISIIKKRGFSICPHRYHCIQNAFMKGFCRTFVASWMFKTSLSLFTSFFAGKLINFRTFSINFNVLKSIFLSRDSLLFSQILALMSFIYKIILCALRTYMKKDSIWYKTIAGFLCGLCILLDNTKRRNTVALYCIVRALSDFVRLCIHYKKIPQIKHFDVAIFTVTNIIITNGIFRYPKCMDPRYYKWFKNIGNIPEKQIQFLRDMEGHKPFISCPHPLWHHDMDPSCVRYTFKYSFRLFTRAIIMYIPVHCLPMVLFTPKKIIENPMQFIQRKSTNTIISALFVAVYGFNLRYSICGIRELFKRDPKWLGLFAGCVSGLSIFIENSKRRPELMLYCIPRAMECCMRRVDINKFPNVYKLLRSNVLPTITFQIAVALWMTIMNVPKGVKISNSINMTILKIIFGTIH